MTGVPPGRGRVRFGWAALGFLAGLVSGYVAILFGWAAFATPNQNSSGGDAIAIAFFVAPAGGLILAVIGAIWLGWPRTAQA